MRSRRIRLLAEMMRGNRLRYLGAVLAMATAAAISFVSPMVLRGVIDALTAASEGDWSAPVKLPGPLGAFFTTRGGVRYLVGHLWQMAVILLSIYLLSGLMQYLRGRLIAQSSERFAENLRNRLYTHLDSLPFNYHARAQTGDLIQRCTSDVETIRRFLSNQSVEVFRTIVMLAIGIPVLAGISWRATLFSVMLFLPMALLAIWFFKWVRRYFTISDTAEGRMSAVLQENLTGVRVVRAFGRQAYEEEKFNAANDDLHKKTLKLYDIMALFWSCSDGIGTLQISIALIAGVVIAVNGWGNLSAGDVTVFVSYVSMLIWPVRQLGRVLSEFGKSLVSLERLDEILRQPPEQETEGAFDAPLDRDIRFEHVRFCYSEDAPLLKDVHFSVRAGQTVAILGATGSGKSTMMQLLQRLYDVKGGQITIGGVSIEKIRKQWLRSRVGLILQEPFLYSRTVRDNIRITVPDADAEQVARAARLACADGFIREFERGYETPVGERGVTLSGGQKQRVAIARTLLRENDILIFDDSLSAVDTQTDRAIRQALRELREEGEKTATTFIISHRLTTLSEADLILVLEDGVICQQGTHSELIQKEGLYRRIYQIQSALEEEISEPNESGDEVSR